MGVYANGGLENTNPLCFRNSTFDYVWNYWTVLGPDSDSPGFLGSGSAHFQPQRTLGGEFWAKTKF